MPPTPGAEWAVARFQLDDMHSNDTHSRVLDPKQRYSAFGFTLNGDLKEDSMIELDWVVLWRGKDDQPPTAPTDVKAERRDGKLAMRWTASTDNVHVFHYELLRKDGEAWTRVTVATSATLDVPDAELPAGPYAVRAVDVAGNLSAAAEIQVK